MDVLPDLRVDDAGTDDIDGSAALESDAQASAELRADAVDDVE